MVKYDGTVRDSSNNIIQFLYGEDGINAEYIENQRIELIGMQDSKLAKMCQLFAIPDVQKGQIMNVKTIFQEIEAYRGRFSNSTIQTLQEDQNFESIRKLNQHFIELIEGRSYLRRKVIKK